MKRGQLSVSSWFAFGVDVAVLLALILGRPDLEAVRQPLLLLANVLPAVYGLRGALVVLASLAGLASLVYGSPDAALAHLRGERISLYPRPRRANAGASRHWQRKALAVGSPFDFDPIGLSHSLPVIDSAHTQPVLAGSELPDEIRRRCLPNRFTNFFFP